MAAFYAFEETLRPAASKRLLRGMSPKFSVSSLIRPSFVILTVTLGAAGCVTMETTARTRASNDLRCGEESVVVKNIGGSSYRATGCGQEVTYNCAQSSGNTFVCRREEQKPVAAGR